MAVEKAQEKQAEQVDNQAVSTREALSNEALSQKNISNADLAPQGSSSSVKDALPGLSIANGAEKHGIRTTYDENGNATSDCFGPIPRPIDQIGKPWEHFPKPFDSNQLKIIHKDGVEKISTGDFVVKKGDTHQFLSKDGDNITVNADGTSTISGDINKTSTKNGVTTVEFRDGAVVTFDDRGIRSVTRDGQTVTIKEVKVMPLYREPFIMKGHGMGALNSFDNRLRENSKD